MKVFAEKTVIRPQLEEVRCNKCGRALRKAGGDYFEDYLSVTKTWGYHSPMDGETHSFDLCAECFAEFVRGFKIPPVDGRDGEPEE